MNFLLILKVDEGFDDTPSRSSRGLRVLSLKVKEIVCQRQKATYKEVAEYLIEDLDLKAKMDEKVSQIYFIAFYVAILLSPRMSKILKEECMTL